MNGDGNFKMKCIDNNAGDYTVSKTYEVINGVWVDDDGDLKGDENIRTIDDVNNYSYAKWELVEEISEPVKEEKSLIKIVMEHLGVEEGEEFNIIWDGNDSGSLAVYNPFMFKNGNLLSKYKNSRTDFLGRLITGESKIEKLKWKPKNGEKVWIICSDENKNSWCNYSTFKDYSSSCIALYKMGWLFETEKEAEANMKRVLKEMKEVMEK